MIFSHCWGQRKNIETAKNKNGCGPVHVLLSANLYVGIKLFPLITREVCYPGDVLGLKQQLAVGVSMFK